MRINCKEYSLKMQLLELRLRIERDKDLTEGEKREILRRIKEIEERLKIDA